MIDLIDEYKHLELFQEIKLTHREIDVISCILNGRTSKKSMASFLSIEPRTAETHVRNLINKLRCSSWEQVRDRFSESPLAAAYSRHFEFLKIQKQFIELLHKIPNLRTYKKGPILVLYDQNIPKKLFDVIKQIQTYLLEAGFFIILKKHQEESLISRQNKEKYIALINVVSEKAPDFNKEDYKLTLNLILSDEYKDTDKVKNILLKDNHNLLQLVVSILKEIVPQAETLLALSVLSKYIPSDKGSSVELRELLSSETPISKKKKRVVYAICIVLAVLIGYQKVMQDPTTSIISIQSLPEASIILKRDQIIRRISSLLKSQATSNNSIPIVVLAGMGGSGKTTLARLWSQKNSHHKIIWEINAETTESTRKSFKDLANVLANTPYKKERLSLIEGMQDSAEKEKRRLLFVQEQFRNTKDWVLIFDNATYLKDFLLYFPHTPKIWGTNGKVIITTRNARLKIADYIPPQSILQVGELSLEEKLSLFSKTYVKHTAQKLDSAYEKEMGDFLEKIPPFPLDVSLAAKYLANYKISFSEYLAKLTLQNRLFETQLNTTLQETNEYTQTRNSIIALGIDQILSEQPEFLKSLLIVSLLHPINIPIEFLASHLGKDHVTSFIQKLQHISLCSSESSMNEYRIFSFHRSIHENIHQHLKTKVSSYFYDQTFLLIKKLLSSQLNMNINRQNTLFTKLLLPHGEFILSRDLNGLPATELLVAIGGAYYEFGDDLKAVEYLERSLNTMRKQKKENSLDFARASSYLGVVAMRRGEFKKSLRLLESAIPGYKTSSDTIGYVRTLVFLGHLYTLIDRYSDASKTFDLSLELCNQKALESTNLPRALLFSGILYREMGKYSEAMVVTEESIKNYKSGIPYMWALAYLGSIELELGNYTVANDALFRSITFYRNNNASKHVSLGWILPTLGSIYRKMGQYDKAMALFEEALEIYNHTNTETSRNLGTPFPLVHMGKLECTLGHYKKAKHILEEALSAHIEIYDVDNIRTKWAAIALAQLYLNTENYKKAEELVAGSIHYYESLLPSTHPKIGKAYRALGASYLGLKDIQKAKTYLEKGLLVIKQHFPSSHVEEAYTYKLLGDLYIHEGSYEKAENYLQKAIKIYEKIKHPSIYLCYESLGTLFLEQSTKEKSRSQQRKELQLAEINIRKALSIVKKYFPPDSEHIRRLSNKLAGIKR